MYKISQIICFVLFVFASTNSFAVVLKISTVYPDGTYIVKALKSAAKDIENKTEGRIKIKFFPGGVQGDTKTVLKKIERGILSGALIEIGAISSEYKDGQVYNTPMIFNTFDEVDYVRKHMDLYLVKGFSKAGWRVFGFIDGGFAYAMTNTPITDIDGLKKQKLWLPANDPLSKKIADAFGLSPIYLGIGEVLTALQTGAINAIVAPPAAALTLQWHSRVKSVTDAPFMYTYGTLAISDKIFTKLSANDQILVTDILSRTIESIDKHSRADNLKAFKALSSQGLEIAKPSAEEATSLKRYAELATKRLVEQGELSQKVLDKLNKLLYEVRAR